MPAVPPAALRRALSALSRPFRDRTFLTGLGVLIGMAFPVTGHAIAFGDLFSSGDTATADEGIYELESGTLTSRVQVIGRNGSAALIQSGGTNNVTAVLTLGSNAGAVGTYTLTGGALQTKELLIGQQGRGVFLHFGGSIRASDLMRVLGSDSSYGMVGSGAALNALGGIRVIDGSFSQSAGLVLGNLELMRGQVTHAGGQRTGGTTQRGGTILHSGGGVSGKLDLFGGTYQLWGGTLTGDVVASGGSFEQAVGGAVVGDVRIAGGRYSTAGVLSSISGRVTLESGTFLIGGNTVLGNGLDNRAAITFFQGRLTVNGAGLRNSGNLSFHQTIDGNGAIVNDGTLDTFVEARIAGSGGFTNNGTLTQQRTLFMDSNGAVRYGQTRLRLANTGTNRNTGLIKLEAPDLGITLDGGDITLQNSGVIELGGGVFDGTGRLSVLASGRLTGFGTIDSFYDSEGQLRVAGGTMKVTRGMLNRGTIDIAGDGAMAGGSIDNRGMMVVRGRVANAVVNTGTVRMPVDGVDPGFDGLFTNQASGVLWTGRETAPGGAPSRTAWLYGGMLNRGRVEVDPLSTLAGGTIDNRGTLLLRGHMANAVENTGLIRSGARAFEGSYVFGTITNQRGGIIRIGDEATEQLRMGAEPWTAFLGRVDNLSGGRIEVVRGGIATFSELVMRSGSVLSITGYRFQNIEGRLWFEDGAILEGATAVKTFRSGGQVLFANAGVRVHDPGNWIFASGGSLWMSIRADGAGITANHVDVDGYLLLTGGTLTLVGLGTSSLDAGDRFDLFDFGVVGGQFAAIDTRFASLRAGLAWDFSDLYRTGEVAVVAVPEPATWASLATGIVLLAGRRAASIRRTRRQNR